MSYVGHWSRGGTYPSAEMQSVYSLAPVDWATEECLDQSFLSSFNYGFIVEQMLPCMGTSLRKRHL